MKSLSSRVKCFIQSVRSKVLGGVIIALDCVGTFLEGLVDVLCDWY